MSAPAISADRSGPAEPYWHALDEGRLTFQRCNACGCQSFPIEICSWYNLMAPRSEAFGFSEGKELGEVDVIESPSPFHLIESK